MKLRELEIRRMPGIDDPFRLTELSPGLNLIVGPNGVGKTTLCRAVRALLWPRAEELRRAWVTALWDADGERLRSERDGSEVGWQRDGLAGLPPELPADSLARCFTLGMLDLLTGDETDEGIAREIRRQMAGGYDMEAVLEESFHLSGRLGLPEKRRLGACLRTVVQRQSEERQLVDREDHLAGLQDDLAAARAARDTLARLETARELSLGRERQLLGRERVAAYPAVLARIRGDELDRLTELEREADELDDQQREVELAADRIAQEVAACALPGGGGDLAGLKLALARARELSRLEARLLDARRDEARAQGELEALAAELDPTGRGRRPRIGGHALEPAAALLRRAAELGSRRAAVDARLELLGSGQAPSEELPRLGAMALRDYLAASAQVAGSSRVAWVLLGVCFVAFAVGALLTRAADPRWLGVAGLAGGALLATGLIARLATLERRASARRFRDLGLPVPKAWTRAAVATRLRELDDEVARALRAREDEAEGKRLRAELPELETREAELGKARAELRAALGVDLSLSDLSAAVLAERVRAYADGERALSAASALTEELERDCLARATELNAVLRGHGEATLPLVDDSPEDEDAEDEDGDLRRPGYGLVASQIQERLEELRERVTRLDAAVAERQRNGRERDALVARQARLAERSAELYNGCEVVAGDRGAVVSLVEQLAGYRREVDDLKLLERSVADLEAELASHPELRELAADAIDERVGAQAAVAARLEDLAGEVRSIQDALDRAHGGDAIERALADRDEAREELEKRREEVLSRTAGRFLVERVTEQYEEQTRPEVMRRAQAWFAAFTHHAYDLKLEGGQRGATFRAVDNSSSRGLSLSQLSDGTRMQLLLAVRLAFATTAERSTRLPIFLDDVLTTSDPARFRAVAESIAILIREDDRQVFYLTCNPTDTDHWAEILAEHGMPESRPIDLGAVRGRSVAVTEVAKLERPPLPEVPSPDWRSSEEYGVLLGVPRLEPRRGIAPMHLFYLLRDDLPLLYRLLTERIETVGKWRAFARSLGTGEGSGVLLSPAEAAGLDAAVRLAEAFLEAYGIGRGRAVDRSVLEESGVVSERYLRGMAELSADVGGDARRLVAAIDDKSDVRVKGFRVEKAEALRAHLLAAGYLDERPVLDRAGVEERVLGVLASQADRRALDPGRVARRVRDLWAASGGGEEETS